MRIEIIIPSKEVIVPNIILKGFKRFICFYKNTLPILAASTPEEIDLSATDESVERFRVKPNVDIVGISISTPFAKRGYEIANIYRDAYKNLGRHIYIVFGGSHATAMKDEALKYGDTVIAGEAEISWPKFLEDFQNGVPERIYGAKRGGVLRNLDLMPIPKRSIIQHKSIYTIESLQLSRGCTNNCEFCSISFDRRVRRMSLERIEEEVIRIRGRHLAILDDNIFSESAGQEEYIMGVLRILKAYKKLWVIQIPLSACADEYLIQEMYGAGCRGIYVGIDSINKTYDGSFAKNRVKDPIGLLRKIRSKGIYVMVGFIYGFDEETKNVFEDTVAFANSSRVNLASFHILTPYPGTALYKRLKLEERLTHDGRWEYFDTAHVVYRPMRMTARELVDGFRYSIRSFYSLRSILNRSVGTEPLHFFANGLYWVGVRPLLSFSYEQE